MRALSIWAAGVAAGLRIRAYPKNIPADIDIPFPSFRLRIAVPILLAC